MSEYTQDALPGVDWEQVAKDYAGDIDGDFPGPGALGDLEYNEEDEDVAAVAETFDRREKGVTSEPIPQTAFVVVINANGDAEAYGTADAWPAETQRQASLGDIRRGCNEIVTEINLQTSSRFTVETLVQVVNTPTPQDRVREALSRRGVDVSKAR